MKKLFCYLFALSATIWGQPAVSPTINPLPTRQFGHPTSENLTINPTQASPNLVLGQEVDAPGQIAFDNSGSSPILYVADIGNNRVLAFKNPASYTAGKIADLVIGQQDMVSTTAQGPTTALSTGLNAPTGVAVDSKGNVYVADSGNNRIMRFPAPFSQPPGAPAQPDLLIGQPGFANGNTGNQGGNCSAKTLWFSAINQPGD
jgi:DNA-binding beta-propeller fold protein YncE